MGSVRVLYERRCAFVNYIRPESAAMALKKLQVKSVCGVCMYNVANMHEILVVNVQGYTIGGCSLVLRYPENAGRPVASPSVQK